jgi:iron complex outermembrane receptor protein
MKYSLIFVPFSMLSASFATHAVEFDDIPELQEEAVYYLSPTRLKQSPHDIPASVSRITSETIESLQIQTIPEVFRYVAGMVSGDASGNQPRVHYHGTNGLIPRRMQVLIDGIAVYRPSYAEVTWPALPISVGDIDVIEVTRSPSAATHGANSMMAVINIKTKTPLKGDKFKAQLTGGSHDISDIDLAGSGAISEGLRYRLSLSGRQDAGYDTNFLGEERRDDLEAKRINASLNWAPDDKTNLRTFVAYSDVFTELEFRDSNQQEFPDFTTESLFFGAEFDHAFSANHALKLRYSNTEVEHKIDWVTCVPTAFLSQNLYELDRLNRDYTRAIVAQQYPTGGTAEEDALRDAFFGEMAALGQNALSPTCGRINEDGIEQKQDIEIEDTLIVSDAIRLVFGAGLMEQSLDSQTYLKGKKSVTGKRIFGNMEYRFSDLVFNIGGMIEDEDNRTTEPEFSPRLGINYRYSDRTSLRFIYSKAIRTSDILEDDLDWTYFARDLTPAYPLDGSTERNFYLSNVSSGEIESEEIVATEVSLYTHNFISLNTCKLDYVTDFKIFRNRLTNLVSEKLQYFDWYPTNDGWVDLKGFEFEGDVKLSEFSDGGLLESLSIHFNYAYIDNDTEEFYEKSLHADHLGALYLLGEFKNGFTAFASYYGNSAVAEESFDGFEFGAGKKFTLAGGEINIKGKAVYLPDRFNKFVVSEAFSVENNYDDNTALFLTINYRYK